MWQHNALAEDLAAHLRTASRRMVWTDLHMGQHHDVRPDVFALDRSYRIDAIAYEVKVSRADLLADLRAGKWRSYLNYACGVYFAAPAGIITKADLPPTVGLLVRGGAGWTALRAPKRAQQPALPADLWMKLLMDGIDREAQRRVSALTPPLHAQWRARKEIGRRYGAELADAIARRDTAVEHLNAQTVAADAILATRQAQADEILARARRDAADIRATVSEEVAVVAEAFGLPRTSAPYHIHNALHRAMQRTNEHSEVAHLRAQLRMVREALDRADVPTILKDDHAH